MNIWNLFRSRYRFGRVLGCGGMGVVREGWRRLGDGTEQRVAFKSIREDRRTSAEVRKRFRREARLTMDSAHQGIVSVHDLVRRRGDLLIVMEFVDGSSLSELAKATPLNHDLIRRVMRDMAEALGFLHRFGITHRDVTPRNILISRKGQVKLTDLGLARHRDDTKSGAGFCCTPGYASEEQLAGRDTDTTTDVYSLAAVGYRLLTGKLPYGSVYFDVVQAMARGLPPLPEDTPEDLRSAIEGAMKSRDERTVRSAEEMLHRIAEPGEASFGQLAAAAQLAKEQTDEERERSAIAETESTRLPQRRRRLAAVGVAAALAFAWFGYDAWYAGGPGAGDAAVDDAAADEPQTVESPTAPPMPAPVQPPLTTPTPVPAQPPPTPVQPAPPPTPAPAQPDRGVIEPAPPVGPRHVIPRPAREIRSDRIAYPRRSREREPATRVIVYGDDGWPRELGPWE